MEFNRCNFRVVWSDYDKEYIGICDEFPSASWISKTAEGAMVGIRDVISDIIGEDNTVHCEGCPISAPEDRGICDICEVHRHKAYCATCIYGNRGPLYDACLPCARVDDELNVQYTRYMSYEKFEMLQSMSNR